MIFGYGRVSTRDQNMHLQEDALKAAGCDRIFTEKVSSTKKNRPELTKLIDLLRDGDTLIVWKLDRLGRSVADLLTLIEQFKAIGVEFVCLTLAMDTRTPGGKLLFNIFSALAEFEKETTIERTMAGLAAARERGRVGGRPKGLSKESGQKAHFAKLMHENGDSNLKIMKALSIKSKETLYRWLRAKGVAITEEEKRDLLISKTTARS